MVPLHPLASAAPKVGAITGPGMGIGAALARRISGLDGKVVLAGRAPSTLDAVAADITATGGQAIAVPGDVAVAADVARVIDATGSRLDALIHSAGVGHCLTIDELDEREWRLTLVVAVTAAFLPAKLALPKLRSSGHLRPHHPDLLAGERRHVGPGNWLWHSKGRATEVRPSSG